MAGLRADTLGVLGGMGPLATADFIRKLIELTPAEEEADHIPLIVMSAPDIPDRVAPIMEGTGPSPLPMLIERRRLLEEAGARAIAMPCNTAHHWESEMTEGSRVPFLSIVDAALVALARRGATSRVGLIGTAATLKSGFFQRRLEAGGTGCVLPEARSMTEAILPGIALVKRNRIDEAAPLFAGAVTALLEAGAEAVVLACTEVDMALAEADAALRENCLDTNRALAQACVAWALGRRNGTA